MDNEKILTGYRINFNTMKRIFSTIFMIHNETVNIWTHLIGVLFFICLIFYTSIYMIPPNTSNVWYPDHTTARKRESELLINHLDDLESEDKNFEFFDNKKLCDSDPLFEKH
jgi:hypothetical protein